MTLSCYLIVSTKQHTFVRIVTHVELRLTFNSYLRALQLLRRSLHLFRFLYMNPTAMSDVSVAGNNFGMFTTYRQSFQLDEHSCNYLSSLQVAC